MSCCAFYSTTGSTARQLRSSGTLRRSPQRHLYRACRRRVPGYGLCSDFLEAQMRCPLPEFSRPARKHMLVSLLRCLRVFCAPRRGLTPPRRPGPMGFQWCRNAADTRSYDRARHLPPNVISRPANRSRYDAIYAQMSHDPCPQRYSGSLSDSAIVAGRDAELAERLRAMWSDSLNRWFTNRPGRRGALYLPRLQSKLARRDPIRKWRGSPPASFVGEIVPRPGGTRCAALTDPIARAPEDRQRPAMIAHTVIILGRERARQRLQ